MERSERLHGCWTRKSWNMEDWRAGKYTPLFPEDLAKIIENDNSWAGKPITLGSCNTGNSWPGGFGRRRNWIPFAQDLANRLGVPELVGILMHFDTEDAEVDRLLSEIAEIDPKAAENDKAAVESVRALRAQPTP